MVDAPDYSSEAKDVLDFFYSDYLNAIFYFEDSQHESVYERLLRKLIPDLKAFTVVCLGGKEQVTAKAREPRIQSPLRICVLDKDFDELLGKVLEIEGLYYLHRFSIENYLATLEAIVNVAIELNAKNLTLYGTMREFNDFPAYWERLLIQLEKLARLFVVARRFRVNIKTTKMPVEDILEGADDDWPLPTDDWVDEYKAQLQLATHGDNDWLADDAALQVSIESAFSRDGKVNFPDVQNSAHICGKHLLGCLLRFVENRLQVGLLKEDPVSLYARLVGHMQFDQLRHLSESMLEDFPALT